MTSVDDGSAFFRSLANLQVEGMPGDARAGLARAMLRKKRLTRVQVGGDTQTAFSELHAPLHVPQAGSPHFKGSDDSRRRDSCC